MENMELADLRKAAEEKHGGCCVVKRLRTQEGRIRFYVCQVVGEDIVSVIAGGESYNEVLQQL